MAVQEVVKRRKWISCLPFVLWAVGIALIVWANPSTFLVLTDPEKLGKAFLETFRVVGPIFAAVLLLPMGFAGLMAYGASRRLGVPEMRVEARQSLRDASILGISLLLVSGLALVPAFLPAAV